MLSPEQAKTALKEFEAADPKQQIAQASFALGLKRLQRIALGLRGFCLTSDNLPDGEKKKVFETAFDQLALLPDVERACVFGAVFPTLAPQVEGAWRMASRVPYKLFQHHRQAFRAPGEAKTANDVRNRLLRGLLRITPKYRQNIAWYAQYATYVSGYSGDYLGLLLAAAIDSGGSEGEEVFQILRQTATGEHPVGVFGRHVTRGLLMASRPDGWELMEGMIVAAQRQEGLRQVVLETIDEAHPEAFRRMVRTILDHDITRFSACIRAVDAWLAFEWTAMDAKFAAIGLRRLLGFIENRPERESVFGAAAGEELYMALHALAMEDAPQAARRAQAIASDSTASPDRRYVAARLLRLAALPGATDALVPLVNDPDLRVAGEALSGLDSSAGATLGASDLFERLERLLATLKQPSQTLEAIVWPWNSVTVSREAIADKLVQFLGQRSPLQLLPYLGVMSGDGRLSVVHLLAKDNPLPAASREALFALTSDPSSYVRESAFKALEKCRLEPAEAQQIEALLARKSGDVRRAALTALLRQEDVAALASAERLASSGRSEQRAGGVELLAQLQAADRSKQECRVRAQSFRTLLKQRGDDAALRALDKACPEDEDDEAKPATLDDALGLMNPDGRSKPTPPQMPRRFLILSGEKTALASDAARNILHALDDLIARNSEVTVEYETQWGGKQQELLGNISYRLPSPWAGMPDTVHMPLESLWLPWERNRGPELRDSDGFEFFRALSLPSKDAKHKEFSRIQMVNSLLRWFIYLNHAPGEPDFLLDALETACAQNYPGTWAAPKPEEKVTSIFSDSDWRSKGAVATWLNSVREQRELWVSDWSREQTRRYWGLLRWIDEPSAGYPRRLPNLDELIDGYEAGAATADDIYDHLLGPANGYRRYSNHFGTLRRLSTRKMGVEQAKHPWLAAYVDRCRERVVALEVRRGELPGPSAYAAAALGYAGGMNTLIALADALGKSDLSRRVSSWYSAGHGRAETLSKLIKATYPAESDTPDAFAEAARAARIPDKLLVQTAVFAPQWSGHVERALGWPGISEGVWWLHAHTKGPEYGGQAEEWKAEVSRRTPLEPQDLLDGAVDVEWFHRIRESLPAAQWKALDDAAKFTSAGTGHSRAKLFADAMLGKLTEADLIGRIESKRSQEALRALGLVPLTGDEKTERAEVLRRYGIIQEFLRGSKKFGSMRQASEKQAAAIAMQNLARTACYPDPVRLEWAMEQASVADLAGENAVVEDSAGDVTVQLSINEFGDPDLRAFKAGNPLKSIPPTAKKAEGIAELVKRKQEIVRQQSRMRASLESAMCRGDVFRASELQELMRHPILRPMLRSLVFIGDANNPDIAPIMGYPVDGGMALENFAAAQPLSGGHRLRIAHSFDFWQSGGWDKWQWDCFTRERIQPFKQVFRELYLLTPGERENNKRSDRYAGHQVNLKQGLAILGKRGWIGSPVGGDSARTFHAEGITVSIGFDAGYTTPAEVEGLTIDDVTFHRRGSFEPMPLTDVPPRVFSEAMRDIDLLVSVAHQGGVDPEASASTVEMRAALLRDACRLLKIGNVRLEPFHAIIDGSFAKYTVHLGSGVVHRQPGGFLCIVPVHSQHRGRIFLPFADDDPRTAEVISKVILLAKDREIKDPIILEQIYAGVAS